MNQTSTVKPAFKPTVEAKDKANNYFPGEPAEDTFGHRARRSLARTHTRTERNHFPVGPLRVLLRGRVPGS